MAGGPQGGAGGSELERLRAWLAQHAAKLLDDEKNGIHALGIGRKSAGPIDDAAPLCVTGFVERKLSNRELRARGISTFERCCNALSASKAPLPRLDLVETGTRFVAQGRWARPAAERGLHGGPPPAVDLQKRFDVLRAGLGITNPVGAYPKLLSVGTLGFFVSDPKNVVYLVSNNHVIARENAAVVGDAIVQPGTLDLTKTELSLLSTPAKLVSRLGIGKLSAFVELRFTEALNSVDCAIAELDAASRDTSELARVGFGGRIARVAEPYEPDPRTGAITGSTRVHKAGRTTGWTEGEVVALEVLTDVGYDEGVARFERQIAIRPSADNGGPFSRAGDSGSAILDLDHALVGLLFAGSRTRTLANPIHLVLRALERTLGRGKLRVVATPKARAARKRAK